MRLKHWTFLGIFLGLLLTASLMPAVSQQETILTVMVPDWQRNIYSDSLFDEFEAANPGVKVIVVPEQMTGFFFGPEMDEEAMTSSFDEMLKGAGVADVLQVRPYNLTVEATRAGAYLDLKPLIENDPDFDVNDFPETVWHSYQWDNGIWAIPISVNIQVLVYDAKKFDEAGLAYPDETWTLTDLANAARELAQRDEDGAVTLPGLMGYDMKNIVVSLTGQSFLDQDVIPNEPRIDTPELQAFIDEWTALLDEGVIQGFGSYDQNEVPMALDQSWRLQNFGQQDDTHDWRGVLLPGGRAGLEVAGFGVSAGTENPELAYELIKFLSTSPQVNGQMFGERPARLSMIGVEAEDLQFSPPEPSEELNALFDAAIENGIPVADTQFYNYVSSYFMRYEMPPGSEGPTLYPLDEIQQAALDVLAFAERRREESPIVVATPVPTPIIAEGEVVIDFQLGVPFSPIPNREAWDTFLAEFSASDPTVGNVNLLTGFGGASPDEEPVDCYYNSDNQVPSIDLSTVIPLDPFLDADPDFDERDLLGSTMQQLRRENATWAYPVSIQPVLISYDSNLFEQAGVAEPTPDWTVDEFLDTMQQLMDSDQEFEYALANNDFGASHLYLLIAAYGGMPVDYSTTPYTYNLTDPANLDAIRQVLDMAKEGYIQYTELDNTSGGGGGWSNNVPMRSTSLTSLTWDLSWRMSDEAPSDFENPTRYVAYPRGTQSTPSAYSIGTGYITPTAEDPEACYRLIKAIANAPELLLGMPTRRSLLENGDIASSLGDDIADLYNAFAERIDAPDAVVLPGPFNFNSTLSSFIESIWVNQAFDSYVLEDGNLEEDLAEAQRQIDEYRACVGEEGPTPDFMNMTEDELRDYYSRFSACAEQVDPELEGRFNFFGDSEEEDEE
jgi:ABC-type glycerol-3-phosphate transport system substrate-binding protein